MVEKSSFRQNYLATRSWCSADVGNLIAGHFDLMMVSSSWDARSISIAGAPDLTATLGIGIFSQGRDSQGLRDAHDRTLTEYCRAKCRRFEIVEGPSTNVEVIWEQVKSHVFGLARVERRPLRVLIDLSACPRFFSLGLLALGLSQRFSHDISILYAEGLYPELDANLEVAFTGGRWRTVPVPYLEGICDPGKDRFYFVSVGFEGSKTLRTVSQADPDRVSVMLPAPGSGPGYARRTEESNSELIRQFRVPSEQIVKTDAVDAVQALKALHDTSIDRRATENPYYLCCGTKPHAVSLALRALALERPAVLYMIPEEHRVHNTRPNGSFWRYDIQDVTALPFQRDGIL